MAGVELAKYAIVHEMSNQQSEKRSHKDNTKLEILRETCHYLQRCSFTFLHCPICT